MWPVTTNAKILAPSPVLEHCKSTTCVKTGRSKSVQSISHKKIKTHHCAPTDKRLKLISGDTLDGSIPPSRVNAIAVLHPDQPRLPPMLSFIGQVAVANPGDSECVVQRPPASSVAAAGFVILFY